MPYVYSRNGAVTNRTPLAIWIFVCVGALMVLLSLGLSVRQAIFVSHAQRTVGVLDDLTPVYDRKGTTYRPTFSYRTQTGQVMTIRSRVSTSSSSDTSRPGDPVQILYDPSNPEHAEIDSFMRLWFAPTLVGGMGVFFLLLVGGIAWLARSGGAVRVDSAM